MFQKYYKKNVPKKYRKLGKQIKFPSSLAQLSKRVATIRQMLNVETKTVTAYSVIGGGVANVGSVFGPISYLTTLSQGNTETTRVGNSIKLKGMNVRLQFTANGLNSIPQNVRVLLVKDLNRNAQPDGTDGPAPTLGSVITPDVPATSQVTNLYNFLNDNTSGRYKIIMNKMFTLDRGARAGLLIDKYFKLDDELKYATNTSTNPINGYYLWFMGDASGSNVPNVTGVIRTKFIDN